MVVSRSRVPNTYEVASGQDLHLDKRVEPISWIQAIRDKRSIFNLFPFSLRSYRVFILV